MNESKNIHAGHRERMFDKLLKDSSAMPDHELLEILLFYSIPRRNTNDIAHRLIRTFGGLDKVFQAKPEELLAVDGVGKRVVASIILFGQFFNRLDMLKNNKPIKLGVSFAHDRKFVRQYFDDYYSEKAIILLLDSKGNKITELTFDDTTKNSVIFDIQEVTKVFAITKPAFAILAHNHPSGNPEPSDNDDMATTKLLLLCSIHGVTMLDHIIITKTNAYSYYADGRLQKINESFKLEKLLDGIKTYEQ